MSLGPELVPAWGLPPEPLVIGAMHRPALTVRDAVVISAKQCKALRVRLAAISPGHLMVSITPLWWILTSWPRASTISVGQRLAESVVHEPLVAAEIEHDSFCVDDDRPEHWVTQQSAARRVADRDSVCR
ncbi:MAG: hypothetical protein R2735_14330 [Microthrixaceae bacterium]